MQGYIGNKSHKLTSQVKDFSILGYDVATFQLWLTNIATCDQSKPKPKRKYFKC